MDGRRKAARLYGEREVARAAQEGEAGGGDLLGLVRGQRRGRRPPGDVRLQRRSRRIFRLPAPRRCRAAAGRVPGERHAPADAASPRAERGLVARFHRSRVRRPRGDGVQPHHRRRGEGRHVRRQERQEEEEGRRERPAGVLRLQARPRVAVRVHEPLAVAARPVGLTGLHRGGELRRVSRRPARANAAGERRDRVERRDPDLARARVLHARFERLRRPRLGRPAAHHGCGRNAPRALARVRSRNSARRGPARSRAVRNRRLHGVPHARRLHAAGRSRARSQPARRLRRPARGHGHPR